MRERPFQDFRRHGGLQQALVLGLHDQPAPGGAGLFLPLGRRETGIVFAVRVQKRFPERAVEVRVLNEIAGAEGVGLEDPVDGVVNFQRHETVQEIALILENGHDNGAFGAKQVVGRRDADFSALGDHPHGEVRVPRLADEIARSAHDLEAAVGFRLFAPAQIGRGGRIGHAASRVSSGTWIRSAR